MESFEALEIYQKIIYGNLDNGEFFYLKSTVDAEIAQLMAIAYPDGPQADAAVPMSRYEPVLKSERKLRYKLSKLEAERNAAIKAISEEATKRGRLEAEVERKDKALAAVLDLIEQSQGVYGLHLNGDGAPWETLRTGGQFEQWLIDFDEALEGR